MASPEGKKELKKRQRTENWLEEDKILLVELVRLRVQDIENKNSDTTSNKKKQAAWLDLQQHFNAMCFRMPRTVTQLKAQWTTLKMVAKKEKSLAKDAQIKTEEGPPSTISKNTTEISSWLLNELSTDSNEGDSDGLCQTFPGQDPLKLPQPDTPVAIDSDSHNQVSVNSQLSTLTKATPETPSEPRTSDEVPRSLTHSQNMIKKTNNIKFLKNKKGFKKKLNEMTEGQRKHHQQVAIIADRCRRELHRAQMENEKRTARNLDLKNEILKEKLIFYRNKNKE